MVLPGLSPWFSPSESLALSLSLASSSSSGVSDSVTELSDSSIVPAKGLIARECVNGIKKHGTTLRYVHCILRAPFIPVVAATAPRGFFGAAGTGMSTSSASSARSKPSNKPGRRVNWLGGEGAEWREEGRDVDNLLGSAERQKNFNSEKMPKHE
jgi:hypothetical protein